MWSTGRLLGLYIVMQVSLHVSCLETKAMLRILMYSYTNPGSKDYEGGKCDWANDCDPQFHFCVDTVRADNDINNCQYYKNVTGEFKDNRSPKFGVDMSGVLNPIQVQFAHGWPGRVNFKIKVEDNDEGIHSPHDLIDRFKVLLEATPARSLAEAQYAVIHATGQSTPARTSFVFYYHVHCMPNYFGPKCEVHCRAQNSTADGHYTCDPDTGAKLCLPGWEEPELSCRILADDCLNHPCLNGGSCVDGHQTYQCICLPGFTGAICHENIDECVSLPCQNGGRCIDLVNGYSCVCTAGYAGQHCSLDICGGTSHQCMNGGTCYIGSGNQAKCLCPPAYDGDLCSIDRCRDQLNCLNGGTCDLGQGHCICPVGYLGLNCDVSICETTPCHNGGSCLRGRCECQPGFYGRFCELEFNECSSNPCLNDGSCVDRVGGYACRCLAGFDGDRCQSVEAPLLGTPPPPDVVSGVTGQASTSQGGTVVVLETWMIAVIAVCILLVLALIIILFLVSKYRKKKKQLKEANQQTNDVLAAANQGRGQGHVNQVYTTEVSECQPRESMSVDNIYSNVSRDGSEDDRVQYVNGQPRGASGFAYVVPTHRQDKRRNKGLHVNIDQAAAGQHVSPSLPPRGPESVYARPGVPRPLEGAGTSRGDDNTLNNGRNVHMFENVNDLKSALVKGRGKR